jgi:hypothetical protein
VHLSSHLSVYSGKLMEAMRESWTDARLDDFARHTDHRFDAIERRMETGFGEINDRFDALQRTLLQLGGGLLVALVGLLAALIGLIGTQL